MVVHTFFFVPICTFSLSARALMTPSPLDSPLVAFSLSAIYLTCKPVDYMLFLFSKRQIFFLPICALHSSFLDCCTFLSFFCSPPVILVDLTLIGSWSNFAVGINNHIFFCLWRKFWTVLMLLSYHYPSGLLLLSTFKKKKAEVV